eukprot:COSAG05_NODE_32_length_28165_cov_450.666714_27_plen_263_part_00
MAKGALVGCWASFAPPLLRGVVGSGSDHSPRAVAGVPLAAITLSPPAGSMRGGLRERDDGAASTGGDATFAETDKVPAMASPAVPVHDVTIMTPVKLPSTPPHQQTTTRTPGATHDEDEDWAAVSDLGLTTRTGPAASMAVADEPLATPPRIGSTTVEPVTEDETQGDGGNLSANGGGSCTLLPPLRLKAARTAAHEFDEAVEIGAIVVLSFTTRTIASTSVCMCVCVSMTLRKLVTLARSYLKYVALYFHSHCFVRRGVIA